MQEFSQTRNGQVFLNNVQRISGALERIASALETRPLLLDVLTAFEGEEASVQEEHAALIARIRTAVQE